MAAIKSAADIANKWSRTTPGRTADYEEGVRNPRKDWHDNSQAANDAYKTAIQQSVAEDRWSAGVRNAGTARWKEGATTKGVARWGPGVQIAKSKYQEGIAPYVDLITRLDLPPRGAKGDPANIERVRVVAGALHDLKRQLKS